VPIAWFLEETEIDLFILSKEDEDNFEDNEFGEHILVFKNITELFSRNYDEKGSFQKGIEPIICELNSNFYVSADVDGFKCGPKEISYQNALKFLVQLNPPLIVENKSMMPLKVFEVNNPGES